jgi:hypothetical protein|nr:hypothetical protein [uncultured Dialister sp.]DAP87094.1 MAG TPA: hypothetical protein [Caudoviricetes sp.]
MEVMDELIIIAVSFACGAAEASVPITESGRMAMKRQEEKEKK